MGPPGVFKLSDLSPLRLWEFLLVFRFSCAHWFPQQSLLTGLSSVTLYLNVSPILGAGLCPVSSSLSWIQITFIDFSVCSGFRLCLGWSDNSQAPYVQNYTRALNGFCSPRPLLLSQSGLPADRCGWRVTKN